MGRLGKRFGTAPRGALPVNVADERFAAEVPGADVRTTA